MGRLLDGLLEARDEEQQERRDGDGDQGEVPVEPEHQAEHADDGEQIDEDVERGGGGEALDGLDVGGDGAEDRAGLVGVVVAEREALQVMISAHAQIVGDPLADALGVVVVDVGGDGADDGDHDEGEGGKGGDVELVASLQHGAEQMMKPGSELVVADDVVEDDLQRPWGREAHRRFDQHAEEE